MYMKQKLTKTIRKKIRNLRFCNFSAYWNIKKKKGAKKMPSQKICETLFKLVMCHLVGDYVLQIDFIAKTKSQLLRP